METLAKNSVTGRWEKAQSPEPILPPALLNKRPKIYIKPNWLMIGMFILAIPCTGYLIEEPSVDIRTMPVQVEEHEIEVIVDSIFRSVATNQPIFAKPVDHSRFKEWMHYLKAREGFVSEPDPCPAGYLTVGYGHNIGAHGWLKASKYMKDGRITYRAATQLLYDDVEEEITRVRTLAPHLNRDQTLAVASLFANCGSGKIIGSAKRPTPFWRAIKAGKIPNFEVYTKYKKPLKGGKYEVVVSPNLVAARSFEQSLFEGGTKPVKIYGGGKFRTVTFEQAARHYQAAVITRDILPSKKRGQYQ